MSITLKKKKKQLPGPLRHLCTSVTLICSKVYCPLLVHLFSSLSPIHPTTKSRDDPFCPGLSLARSSLPTFRMLSLPESINRKTPSSPDGKGMKGGVCCFSTQADLSFTHYWLQLQNYILKLSTKSVHIIYDTMLLSVLWLLCIRLAVASYYAHRDKDHNNNNI